MNVTGAHSGEVEAEAGACWPCPTENLELGHLRERGPERVQALEMAGGQGGGSSCPEQSMWLVRGRQGVHLPGWLVWVVVVTPTRRDSGSWDGVQAPQGGWTPGGGRGPSWGWGGGGELKDLSLCRALREAVPRAPVSCPQALQLKMAM